MLTAKQFEAIGRLTIAFNEVENAFEYFIAQLIGAPEWGVSFVLAAEGTFHHKADRLEQVLESIRQHQSDNNSAMRDVVHAQIQTLSPLIKRARDLAKERNTYAHAWLFHDFGKNETKLLSRKGTVSCDEKAVFDLAAEAWAVAWELQEECDELLKLLGREAPLPNGWGVDGGG